MEKERYIIQTLTVALTKKATIFKEATIKNLMKNLWKEKSLKTGNLVTILEWPYAHDTMMVLEVKYNGMITILPAPQTPIFEIHKSKVFHKEDYDEAFSLATMNEHIYNMDIAH